MPAYTFQASFAGRFTCTVTFDPAIHFHGKAGQIGPAKHWHPQPPPADEAEFFNAYRAWIHTVNAQIAKIVNVEYRSILQNRHGKPPAWQAWIYQPDGTKKCVAKGTGIFNPATDFFK